MTNITQRKIGIEPVYDAKSRPREEPFWPSRYRPKEDAGWLPKRTAEMKLAQ